MPGFVPVLIPLMLLGLRAAMMALGTGPVDRTVLAFLYSADQPAFRSAARAITLVGEWQTMLALAAIVALWLMYRRKLRSALLFLFVTLSGRLLALLQKEAVGRLRPHAQEHLVVGLSRPMLGVHWPSDVIGGWSFSALWVLLFVRVREQTLVHSLRVQHR